MLISEEEKNRILNLHKGKGEKVINEEPEKDTYYVISKAERADLIAMGGKAEEIGNATTNDFSKYCR